MHSRDEPPSIARRLPIGAEVVAGGVHFRLWAPRPKKVALVWDDGAGGDRRGHVRRMRKEEDGYWALFLPEAGQGTLYGFRLDDDAVYPDPASRFQPGGVEGWSQVIDPAAFVWTDSAWRGVPRRGRVLYEMHIGTFTPEGTWAAAARELPELARIGVNVLQVMPVAEFPGRFGWGYDGVFMFAPTRLYGTPDDMRCFVDEAHRLGLAVILDVVYNHFGNVGNYLAKFSAHYCTDRRSNPWGAAINFDGDHCDAVREFFLANARYWIEEYHLDGFRFDATEAIFDASPEHILAGIARLARASAGNRALLLVAEDVTRSTRFVEGVERGGMGLDAILNDDFHHAARVSITGHNPAFLSDFRGGARELSASVKHGFLYQGQFSRWAGERRGTPTRGFPASSFVHFLQNHDQVANAVTGERPHRLTSPGRYRAITALWLLAPQTPLFFQGQEFSASRPFLFFADYSGEMGEAMVRGRREFVAQFVNPLRGETIEDFPIPTDTATFHRCKLDFGERLSHRASYDFHQDLLRMRREDPVFSRERMDLLDTATLGPDCMLVRYFSDDHDDRLLLVNLGEDFVYFPAPQPLLAPPRGRTWEMLWTSELPCYGGAGHGPVETSDGWRIPAEAAVAFRAVETGSLRSPVAQGGATTAL